MTEASLKLRCDEEITAVARMLISEMGAPFDMVVDRLLTFSAAHMTVYSGKELTAEAFRLCAKTVEDGAFDYLKRPKPMRPQ